VVEHLPSKNQALSSNPNIKKKNSLGHWDSMFKELSLPLDWSSLGILSAYHNKIFVVTLNKILVGL
jgi:hypothetical protein